MKVNIILFYLNFWHLCFNFNVYINRNNLDYVVDETCSRMRENCTPSTTTSFPSFLSTSSSSTLSSSSSSSSSTFSSNFWNLSSRADRSHLVIDFVFSTLGKQEISGTVNSTVSLFTDYEILKGNRIFFFSNFI